MHRRPGLALFLTLLFLGSAFAGCVEFAAVDDLEADGRTSDLQAAGVTEYLRNLSEPLDGVNVVDSVVEQLRIPAPDGVALDTWVVRPPMDEPVPVVLTITPYYGGGNPVIGDVPPVREDLHYFGRLAEVLVPRGYAVAISSVRGTGNSEGCFTQGGPTEAKDSAAVVEALAAEEWTNGNVGLIGVSYPGTTPQDVWIEAPPSLKTIVPISGISDFYKYNFVNGVPINVQGFGFNTYYWALVGASPAGLNGGVQVADPVSTATAVAGEACTDQVEVQEGGVSSTLDGNKDAYWQARDFHHELHEDWDRNSERASVFFIHGLQDWNVKPHMMEEWLPALQHTGVPFKAWLGQWAHNWPQREDWWNATLVAWFDEFLKEHDTGILDAPAVQVQSDDGVWRHEAVWPPRDVDAWTLHPNSNGTLNAAPGSGVLSYHDQWGRALDLVDVEAPASAEEAVLGDDRVLFRSEPLAETVTVSGQPLYAGNVTATGQRASLMLTLAEELPDGTLRAFNYAAQSLNHVESLESGNPDISDLTQQVSVRFFPQDDVVQEGSRLVLLASGNLLRNGNPGPSLQPVSDGSWISLHLEGARLELPIDRTLTIEDPQPCWEEECHLVE